MSKKHKNQTKFSRLLTADQVRKYKEFGEPIPDQNYLELFTPTVVSDLFTIMRSCSDNQKKSDYISKELADMGFEDVGLGTNILAMSNPVYPGVVFKIALDDYGLADNFNDCILQDIVPKYVPVYARHPSGIVSVQKRGVLMTDNQMSVLYPRIMELLKELSKYFLIADLSPDMFLNYAIDRNGDFMIIDGSDLYPLHQLKDKPRCKKIIGEHKNTGEFKYCEGKLEYTEDFKYLVCKKCGREYNPLQFRPKKEVKEMSKLLFDGMSLDEMMALEEEAMDIIRGQKNPTQDNVDAPKQVTLNELSSAEGQEDIKSSLPRTIFVEPDESLEEDDEPVADTPDEDEIEEDIEKVVKSSVFVPASPVETFERTVEGEDEAEVEVVRRVTIDERNASASTNEDVVVENNQDLTLEMKLEQFGEKLIAIRERSQESFEKIANYLVESVLGREYLSELIHENDEPSEDTESTGSVQNDLTNTDMSEVDEYDSDTPHIHYWVRNESDKATSPGIFLNIHGDFEESYEESGLPVFVTIDGGRSYAMAIMASEMKKLMRPAIDDLLDEQAEMIKKHLSDDSEEDELEDDEEVISPEDLLNHEYFKGLGEDTEESDESGQDDEDEEEDDDFDLVPTIGYPERKQKDREHEHDMNGHLISR